MIQNKKINLQKIAAIIKKVPRGNDIVAFGKNSTFYLILYNSGNVGAKSVFSRIKNALANECKIYANSAEITAAFEEMESVLLQSLKDQISAGIEFNYLYDIAISEAEEFLNIKDETGKKFMDFKKEFFEKFEKIVAPVFYETRTQASNILPEAKISFDITETESKFTVSNDTVTSELLITYPSYMKLLLDVKHTYSSSKRPKVRRLTFDFEDFSSEKLLSILKDILKEFASKLNKEKIEKKSVSKSK